MFVLDTQGFLERLLMRIMENESHSYNKYTNKSQIDTLMQLQHSLLGIDKLYTYKFKDVVTDRNECAWRKVSE